MSAARISPALLSQLNRFIFLFQADLLLAPFPPAFFVLALPNFELPLSILLFFRSLFLSSACEIAAGYQ